LAGKVRLLPLGIEGQYFKPVPEGWLFGAPKPWFVFGRRPTYLVTEAQKAALVARVRMSRYIRLLLGIPLVAATPLVMQPIRGLPVVDNVMLVLGLYLVAVHALEYFLIKPLLVGLPLATERMTVADMYRQQSTAMSVGVLATMGAFFLFFALIFAYLSLKLPGGRDVMQFSALFATFLAILSFGMLIMKVRAGRPPGNIVLRDDDRPDQGS
jgi:hypothetical protein